MESHGHIFRAWCTVATLAGIGVYLRSGGTAPPLHNQERGSYVLELETAGTKRRALVVPPKAPTAPSPLLMYFHGRGGTAAGERKEHRFESLWPEAIVVYMEGTCVDSDGIGKDEEAMLAWTLRFPHKASLGQTTDVDYVRAVLTRLTQRHRADPQRVFAAGHSSGAFFVLSLSEVMADEIAGFAASSAYARFKVSDPPSLRNAESPPVELRPSSDAARAPRPILYLFGDTDTVFDHDAGSGGLPGWSKEGPSLCRSTLQQLLIRNSCAEPEGAYWARPTRLRVRPKPGHGAVVEFQLYRGGHGWPRAEGADGDRWVVDFFKSITP